MAEKVCPLLGFNVEGNALVWTATLHLLLLSAFITAFFFALGTRSIETAVLRLRL